MRACECIICDNRPLSLCHEPPNDPFEKAQKEPRGSFEVICGSSEHDIYRVSEKTSALHWLPERNGCKPSQKVFELTILGVCNRYLKKMTADAGITKNVSFHTSRHTFAVLTLAAGSDLYTVGKLLGHTSINSTQVYTDVVMETKVEAISRISNYFSNL